MIPATSLDHHNLNWIWHTFMALTQLRARFGTGFDLISRVVYSCCSLRRAWSGLDFLSSPYLHGEWPSRFSDLDCFLTLTDSWLWLFLDLEGLTDSWPWQILDFDCFLTLTDSWPWQIIDFDYFLTLTDSWPWLFSDHDLDPPLRMIQLSMLGSLSGLLSRMEPELSTTTTTSRLLWQISVGKDSDSKQRDSGPKRWVQINLLQ